MVKAIRMGVKSFRKKAMGVKVAVIASRPRKFKSRVRGAIKPHGPELKYVDTAAATYVADTTGTVTMLNGIAVGDDNTTRDGRQVTIKSVQLHGSIYPTDNTTTASKCRVALVWDNAPNGALATVANIFGAAQGVAFPLIDNANRFTVLVDRTFTIGLIDNTATNAVSHGNCAQDVEIYRKMNNITQYNGTGATIASIQNGALLLVTMGSNAAATSATLLAGTRVRFTDD